MPGRFELKPTLAKIWHAPDHFRIMDPLPSLHRRGIIIGALLIIWASCFLPAVITRYHNGDP
jgi:cell envelope opacity-associated protein A